MTPEQELRIERKMEQMLKGKREIPPGHDYRWQRFHAEPKPHKQVDFRKQFDDTFPGAPGSPGWYKKKFGKKGGK